MINSKTIQYPFAHKDLVTKVEYSNGYPLYIGRAAPGTLAAAAAWQISKLTYTAVSLDPGIYKCYSETITAGTTYAANELDIGADLQTLHGAAVRIPADNGFIIASDDLNMRFNAVGRDVIEFDVSVMGKIWTFNQLDLPMDKIFFDNSQSGASDVTIQVLAAASKLMESDIQFASGVNDYNKVWDDRAGYTYS